MSSRSIASARQKRAGEPVSVATNRPGTYPGQQKPSSQQQASQQYNQKQQQQPVPLSKISISDAIGLITLRLGRAEQFIQQQTHENESSSSTATEKTLPLDKTIINNLLSRVDSIEKRETPPVDTSKIVKMEQELRDIKDLLIIHVMKFEKFVLEMQDKSKKMEEQFQEKLNYLERQITQPVTSDVVEALPESDTSVVIDQQLDDAPIAEVKEDKKNGKKNKYNTVNF